MVLIAVLAAATAGWVAAGPDAVTARLVLLTRTSRAGALRGLWTAALRRRRPAADAAAWRQISIELCQSLAAELTAGRTPGDALARAVASAHPPDPAALSPVAAAARDGGDVAAALRRSAPAAGGEGLLRLAACWRVGVTAGAGLTALVERLTSSLREAEAHRQEVAAQLAGPRATARMLAVLPVLGLLMGAGLGMSPLAFLLGGPAGLACLAVGLGLDAAGVWWTGRLVARAEETPGSGGRFS
ncbi:type II secretion system F family protein [Microbispora sp. ATCC PTA-5024]|uniref:type II secretion system F family protein n=1 Tax=Microbispora sp. ATCC PTA-5024 TaxID=316330 RepID=UPI0003DDD410|nr:type II secretion system F family protein [Microbispora sp. ATCC PTA-5024]ETK34425.1 pilus assembly protein TadB [Microbispora sp. ATCC PTA-5024]